MILDESVCLWSPACHPSCTAMRKQNHSDSNSGGSVPTAAGKDSGMVAAHPVRLPRRATGAT
jgi:hypothetical protein